MKDLDQRRIIRSGTIATLVNQAKADKDRNLRSEQRYPFFQSVILNRGRQSLSAFSRDISEKGMGLLHDMPLAGNYTVIVIDETGRQHHLSAEVIWCRPCGQGWYLSGVQFLMDQAD